MGIAEKALDLPGSADPTVIDRIGPDAPDGKRDILGMSRDELHDALMEAGVADRQARMRTRQIWHWVYHRGVAEFASMTNISKPVQSVLDRQFKISRPALVDGRYSNDGTRKYLLRFADGVEAECVYIPDIDAGRHRGTLCVSSQVGCTLNCRFCHTGTQRLVRNLTTGEIVAQIMHARDDLGEWPASTKSRRVTNIVMMGMGEPLYNFDNVKKALRILMDPEGIQMSRRRITLSTAGVVPMMERCGSEIGVNLAVSLHAVDNETRDLVVPLNRKYPLEQLLRACAAYPGTHNARRITFEYTMLKGINDSDADAEGLVRLIRQYKLPAKVNLIPFNPWPGAPYECSDPERIARFSELVFAAGISAPVRTPRGRDIMAACGQLKSESVRRRKSALPPADRAAGGG